MELFQKHMPDRLLQDLRQAPLPASSPEVCVHWTLVRREKSGGVKAEPDNRYAESIKNLVRATYWHTVAFSIFAGAHGAMDFRILAPLVVVDTNDLWSYDPSDQSMKKADSILVLQNWDVGGTAEKSIVEVVRADAIDGLA